MMERFRRLRWLATLLIAVSPAIGGQVLPLLHPCPVDSPWLAAKHLSHAGMPMPGAGHAAPSHHEAHQHACSCVGVCTAPAITAPPQPPEVVTLAMVEPADRGWPIIEALDRSVPVVDLLPLSTAPPRT